VSSTKPYTRSMCLEGGAGKEAEHETIGHDQGRHSSAAWPGGNFLKVVA
jgi:hypothetical protein